MSARPADDGFWHSYPPQGSTSIALVVRNANGLFKVGNISTARELSLAMQRVVVSTRSCKGSMFTKIIHPHGEGLSLV